MAAYQKIRSNGMAAIGGAAGWRPAAPSRAALILGIAARAAAAAALSPAHPALATCLPLRSAPRLHRACYCCLTARLRWAIGVISIKMA